MGGNSFDDICELAAQIAGAPSAIVTENEGKRNKFNVVGRFGAVAEFGPEYAIPFMGGPYQSIVAVSDLAKEQLFKNHPFRTRLPRVDSAIFANLDPWKTARQMSLVIMNPSPEVFQLGPRYSTLSNFIRHVQRFHESGAPTVTPADARPQGQSGLGETTPGNLEAASVFLLRTLTRKTVLRARGGTSYIAIRTWKKEIKEYQIEALHALKDNPGTEFVEKVASEIHAAAIQFLGDHAIGNVVPIPCNSQRTGPCLSTLVGQAVARRLGVDCHEMLKGSTPAGGRSHPRKSAKLKPYELSDAPKLLSLVVDDVATTGKHMEHAQSAIRKAGGSSFAIAWIGQ